MPRILVILINVVVIILSPLLLALFGFACGLLFLLFAFRGAYTHGSIFEEVYQGEFWVWDLI